MTALAGFKVNYTLQIEERAGTDGGWVSKVRPASAGPFERREVAEGFMQTLAAKPNFISGEIEEA